MKRQQTIYLTVVCYWVCSIAAWGGSASFTSPGGYFLLNIKGASDNFVSLPLVQRPVAFGRVTNVGPDQIVVGSRHWKAGEFRPSPNMSAQPMFYAEFTSGLLRGVSYRVLDNSEDTLLLDTEGDNLTAHPLGAVGFNDTIQIRPLWSVGNVFGRSEAELLLTPKPNLLIPSDSVIFPNNTGIGENKAPEVEISYIHGKGWRSSGDLETDQEDKPFEQGSPLIIRRLSDEAIQIVLIGYVLDGPQSVYVAGGNAQEGNDAYISLVFPEPVTLDEAGLHDPDNLLGSVIRSSHGLLIRGDELLAFGEPSGFNSAPERSFFYLDHSGWREVGSDSIAIGSDFSLEPGRTYIIRKKPGNPGVDWFQTNGH